MIKYIGKCLLIEDGAEKILVVGDLHLGYEEQLNTAGIFISRKMFEEMISEFEKVFKKTGKVDEIVLLGDVKHEFGKISRQEWNDVLGLIDYFQKKSEKIVVIEGNHDKIIKSILKKRDVELKKFYLKKEFCFLHGDADLPEIYDKKIKFWIVGHAHPAVKIRDEVKMEKFKCFLVGDYKKKKVVIVPSFFSYFEGSDPRENDLRLAWKFNLDKFDVKIVQDNSLEVLDFGKLGKLGS